jgi:hypothetical protein
MAVRSTRSDNFLRELLLPDFSEVVNSAMISSFR